MAKNMRHLHDIFKVPAERMEYYYVLPEEMPDPAEGIVGFVVNDTCPDLRLALEIDEDYLKAQKSVFPLLYIDPDNYLGGSRIVITKEMLKDLYRGDPEVLFCLWHEVGQFHTMSDNVEEYLQYADRTKEGMTGDQYLALMKGELLPYQEAADAFAEDYCTPEDSVIALNGMISRAKKHPMTANDRGLIKELLNRKNAAIRRGGIRDKAAEEAESREKKEKEDSEASRNVKSDTVPD